MNKTDGNKTASDLIYLVSCAVNGETPDKRICEGMNLDEVLNLARRHSLSSAAAYALEKSGVISEQFKEEKFKAVRRLSLLNVERVKVLTGLEKLGIWYMPLKGIVLKDYYPKTAMREMSDNDILFDLEKHAEVKGVMEGLGFRCRLYGKTNHDVYEKPPQLDFEMHRYLFDSYDDKEIFDYFTDIKDKLIKDKDNLCGYHMTDEDFYIYLIFHLRKHYQMMGTGLRSLLDIYLFSQKHIDSLNFDYINSELDKLNLSGFEQFIRQFSTKLFSGQALNGKEREELEFVLSSNTHGTRDNLMMTKLNNDDSALAKGKYALKRIFPPVNSLKRGHPIIYSHKYLYPFWLVLRPFIGIVKHRDYMLSETKRLKNFKKKDNKGNFN